MMDWSPRAVHWIASSIEEPGVLRSLARQTGWVHDGLMMVLLIALMTCGASWSTGKNRSHGQSADRSSEKE